MKMGVLISLLVTLSSGAVWAKSNSGFGLGANFGLVNADQKDMDSVIRSTRSQDSASTSNMGNGLEAGLSMGYSFGDVELLLRPSYYWVSEEGKGNTGNHEYGLSAFSIMPFLRWNLLSNQTIAFYTQLGLGWIYMMGEIKEADSTIEFSGSTIGYAGGMGAEFCFFGPHCFYLEANLRVASVDRMTIDKYSLGSYNNGRISPDQGKGKELEIGGRDFAASLSGIQGVIGYNIRF